MKNIQQLRQKKQRKSTLERPFDHSIIDLQLKRCEDYLKELMQSNPSKIEEIQKSIQKDLVLLSHASKKKVFLQIILLNLQALYNRRLKEYSRSYELLEKAEEIVGKQGNPLDMARIRFSQCLVLSDMKRYEKANEVAKIGITDLQNNFQRLKKLKVNQRMMEISISIFSIIAVQLNSTAYFQQAKKICQEGLTLATKMLGSNHKLTKTLKSAIGQVKHKKYVIRRRQYSQFHSELGKLSLEKEKKSYTNQAWKELLPQNIKEKEIKRIYNGNKNSRIKTQGCQKWNTHDEKAFLQTLWRVKKMYKERKCPTEQNSMNMSEQTQKVHRGESEIKNLMQLKAKQIILKRRTINRQILLSDHSMCMLKTSCQKRIETEVLERKNTGNIKQQQIVEHHEQKKPSLLQPIQLNAKTLIPPLTNDEGNKDCQLI